jgi:hypothetical protein
MKYFIFNYKTIIIESFLKLRTLISILLILGIDLGFNFNVVNVEEENTNTKLNSNSDKIETNIETEKIIESAQNPLIKVDNNTSTLTSIPNNNIESIKERINNIKDNNTINIEKERAK